MLRFNITQLFRAVLIALLFSIGSQKSGFAQIVPDDTLGAESSVLGNGRVDDNAVQMIEGGATRGGNLFHSFREFNIDVGERVYFANPANIDNVLSRVTGNSLTTIEGVLGVDGSANLFLLNPNGIVFGPEAQLDIEGSFTASTAGSFEFADGEAFSAITSETSLLSVSVPLGIQFNTRPQGNLTNEAILAVGPGEDLALLGNKVSTTALLSAPEGTAEVWGNRIELVERERPPDTNPIDNTEVIFRAANGIIVPNVVDNELRFLDGIGDIQLIADADTDGVGNLVMRDVQDSLRTNGRNLASSGANITLGEINTSVLGDAVNGGNIFISSISGDISTQDLDSSSFSYSGDSGNAGDIFISSNSRDISTQDLSSFSVSYLGDSGNGGAISISSTSGNLSTQDLSSVSVSYLGGSRNRGATSNNGGSVSLHSGNISGLTVITLASNGRTGDIDIQSLGSDLTVSDLSIITTAQIEIPYPIFPGETIFLDLRNIGQSGNISLGSTGGIVLNNVNIQGNANGRQTAGDITITSPSQVTFNNSQISSNATSNGAAGNISINAARLSLGDGDRIFSNTSAAGTGGNITVSTTESVSLGEDVQNFAPIISVEASGAGRTGNIVINTPNFVLAETASITATATSTFTNPDGLGFIELNANKMKLAGLLSNLTETTAQVSVGTLTLRPYQASLNGTQPQSPATADDVLNSGSSFDLSLFEGSRIRVSTNGNGSGANLELLAPDAITISGPGILEIRTSAEGAAGNLSVNARTVTLMNGVTISGVTTGPGRAADMNFHIVDALILDNSIVETLTTPDSVGRDGNINVFNSGATSLINGGSFSLNTEGQGEGGDFSLSSRSLYLDNSAITATTRNGSGGNYLLGVSDYLLLRNGSLISTEAGTSLAGGNGGSISINVPNGFIIARPSENSDIRANAFEGDGGNIDIRARNLLGITVRPDLIDTAASDVASSGTVTIDEINAEVPQPKVELPIETAPSAVSRGCRNQGSQTGSFVSTGRGGLPTSPVDVLSANTLWQDLEPLASTSESEPISSRDLRVSQPPAEMFSSTEKTITEAQGWHRTDDGTVTLIAPSVESSFPLAQASGCGL